MNHHFRPFSRFNLWLSLIFLPLLSVACLGDKPYSEKFDSREENPWAISETPQVSGTILNGVYQFTVHEAQALYWTRGNQELGDGTYEVEAKQTAGTTQSSYGLLVRVDVMTQSYYRLAIDGAGHLSMDKCINDCASFETIVGESWLDSAAIKTGANEWNHLKIEVVAGQLTFFVNGQEVGAAADNSLDAGDVGFFVATGAEGETTVWFDNFQFTPP